MNRITPMRIIDRESGPIEPIDLAITPRLKALYAARGVSHASALDYRLAALPTPDGLGGIELAASLLADALMADQRLLIVGDFDADGATSCALAMRSLKLLGATAVDYLVPNRFEFGYGLSPALVEVASERRPDVLLTVDNGISSHAGVAAAQALGINVVITDHHLPGDSLPSAAAIVNPQVNSSGFASQALAGVGVCFYVMLALRVTLRAREWFSGSREEPALAQLLDLVALGTIADVVPLDHLNRLLVEQGLRRIRAGKGSPGVAALLAVAGRDPTHASASDLGFAAAPRLNAAGRLGDMSVGIETLLAEDLAEATQRAESLQALNQKRRALEREMRDEAMAELTAAQWVGEEETPLEPVLCLYDKRWHQGVVGIVAARMKEQFQRPVIAFAPAENGQLKGSGRSVAGVHLRDLLEALDRDTQGRVIERFGGHAMAAGLTLNESQYEAFHEALVRLARARFADQPPSDVLVTDGELAPSEYSLSLAKELRYAGPWGAEFPEPVFRGTFQVSEQRIVGGGHLKLTVSPTTAPAISLDAIAFNAVERGWDKPGDQVEGVFRLDVNQFRGRESIQLVFDYLTTA
ncbi:MAG: single-stranded-DNA-specific exonuclease RecJ [Spiribacter sp.]|jgi:single-stranded-DNA-specific exonuclease|nr:single-stranded-DNA-specific exonuclease RecJ [Spiribacter sp.]